ncbi:MAG: putative polysaccharide deacetylase [Gemmatimonadetes bacterium]|nr:putative polysaccharide deacetylase [Gemmatimonadota bacterium]
MTLPLILCWHKVERRGELGVTRVSPRRFARQVERLARAGYRTLTLHELLACARGERAAAPYELAITFDDAYRGLREHAFPVLRAHGFGATVGVITDYAGKLNRWDVAYGGRRFAHLAWRDMRAWQARGIEFISHSASHPRLTWLTDGEIELDLARSRDVLRGELDVDPVAVSYPFGAVNARVALAAQRAGFTAGFSLGTTFTGDAMIIPRVPVYLWTPPRPGSLGALERMAGTLANRCAVGTTLIRSTWPVPAAARVG